MLIIVRALLIVALATLVTTTAIAEWRYNETTDEMTGKVSQRFVYTYSENELEGSVKSGPLLLGINCNGSVYMRANDLGLEYESFDKRDHPSRVRFDDSSIETHTWRVWEDNHDGATLDEDTDEFVLSVSRSDRLRIEVKLSYVDGRKQVADFDLDGFSDAYNQCPGRGATASGADSSTDDYLIENCIVLSFVDDLNDEVRGIVLSCEAEHPGGATAALASFEQRQLAGWVLWFLDVDRKRDVLDDGDAVEVTFRIDDAPPMRLDAIWDADLQLAVVNMEDLSLMNPAIDAKSLIYRIGTFGDVHQVAIPEAMIDLVTEFLSRVERAPIVSRD